MANRWAARRAVLPQYLLPKQALTAFGGWVATRRWGSATTRLIAWFVNKYQVDMAEAAQPDIAAYGSFNDFFTRALHSDARPLVQARWPVRSASLAPSRTGKYSRPKAMRTAPRHWSAETARWPRSLHRAVLPRCT